MCLPGEKDSIPAFQDDFEINCEKTNWSGVETSNATITISNKLSFDGK